MDDGGEEKEGEAGMLPHARVMHDGDGEEKLLEGTNMFSKTTAQDR